MALAAFIPNPSFIADLARSPDYTEALEAKANEAKGHAESVAPVETGTYKGSFKVTVADLHVYLGNYDWKAHLIEFGTVDTPVYAPLRLGVTSAGLRFTDPTGPS